MIHRSLIGGLDMWASKALPAVSSLAVLVRGALLAGLIGSSGVAHAQPSNRAAQLFDAGVADLKLEKYETACATLEESYGIDANLGTLMALGDCLERWGKLHSAALRFEALIAAVSANATASAYRAGQLEYARSALARLGPRIPALHLILPTPGEPELRVQLDGQTLELAPPEQEVALDPGRHSIETQAPGREPWRLELDVRAGEQRRVELQLGRSREPAAPAIPPTVVSVPAPEPRATRPTQVAALDASEPASNPWRTLGWGLGGLGLAGMGVGAVAGVMVLETCPGLDCADNRGKHLALVTDIGFGVGLAALGASLYLLLETDPPPRRAAEESWQPLGGLNARGGWLGVGHSF